MSRDRVLNQIPCTSYPLRVLHYAINALTKYIVLKLNCFNDKSLQCVAWVRTLNVDLENAVFGTAETVGSNAAFHSTRELVITRSW